MIASTLLLTLAVADPTPPRFEFVLLTGNWNSLGWRYEEPKAPGADVPRLFTAGEADVESYAWASQTITLTQAASRRLIEATQALPRAVPRLDALKESLGQGDPLERALYLQAFVVRLDGQALYWGICLDPPSQMAIDFPVLRAGMHDAHAVFHVLPVHIPFFESDPGASGDAGTRSPEAREVPSEMLGLFRAKAEAPGAKAFRARIRDERVRRLFEGPGALRP